MTVMHDGEGEPALPAAHPSVRAVLSRRRAGEAVGPPPVLDADWLRELCLATGADDVAAVGLDHPDLAGEREYVLGALPGTRTLIAMAFRMNRDNCRSPARSVANQEFHQTDEQANHAARGVVQALQDAGHRAINPSVGFPQEMDRFGTDRIWVVAHKTVAVAAADLSGVRVAEPPARSGAPVVTARRGGPAPQRHPPEVRQLRAAGHRAGGRGGERVRDGAGLQPLHRLQVVRHGLSGRGHRQGRGVRRPGLHHAQLPRVHERVHRLGADRGRQRGRGRLPLPRPRCR